MRRQPLHSPLHPSAVCVATTKSASAVSMADVNYGTGLESGVGRSRPVCLNS